MTPHRQRRHEHQLPGRRERDSHRRPGLAGAPIPSRPDRVAERDPGQRVHHHGHHLLPQADPQRRGAPLQRIQQIRVEPGDGRPAGGPVRYLLPHALLRVQRGEAHGRGARAVRAALRHAHLQRHDVHQLAGCHRRRPLRRHRAQPALPYLHVPKACDRDPLRAVALLRAGGLLAALLEQLRAWRRVHRRRGARRLRLLHRRAARVPRAAPRRRRALPNPVRGAGQPHSAQVHGVRTDGAGHGGQPGPGPPGRCQRGRAQVGARAHAGCGLLLAHLHAHVRDPYGPPGRLARRRPGPRLRALLHAGQRQLAAQPLPVLVAERDGAHRHQEPRRLLEGAPLGLHVHAALLRVERDGAHRHQEPRRLLEGAPLGLHVHAALLRVERDGAHRHQEPRRLLEGAPLGLHVHAALLRVGGGKAGHVPCRPPRTKRGNSRPVCK